MTHHHVVLKHLKSIILIHVWIFFVEGWDHGSYTEEECRENDDLKYSCCDWYAEALELDKVKELLPDELKFLNDEEILEIQNQLCEKLRVGSCGWCV